MSKLVIFVITYVQLLPIRMESFAYEFVVPQNDDCQGSSNNDYVDGADDDTYCHISSSILTCVDRCHHR